MKATLTFTLPEDEHAFKIATHAQDLLDVVRNMLCDIEYVSKSDTEQDKVEYLRVETEKIISEYGLRELF
ncbi:MAG: hypothetical protein ABIP54_02135 [Candidatus Andersenbacteria bacterium]